MNVILFRETSCINTGIFSQQTSETTVTEEAGNLKLSSKAEGQITMKTDNTEEWTKQLQASTVKSEGDYHWFAIPVWESLGASNCSHSIALSLASSGRENVR